METCSGAVGRTAQVLPGAGEGGEPGLVGGQLEGTQMSTSLRVSASAQQSAGQASGAGAALVPTAPGTRWW